MIFPSTSHASSPSSVYGSFSRGSAPAPRTASRGLGFLCWTQNILIFRTRKNKMPCVRRRARAKPSMGPLRGEGKALGGVASRGGQGPRWGRFAGRARPSAGPLRGSWASSVGRITFCFSGHGKTKCLAFAVGQGQSLRRGRFAGRARPSAGPLRGGWASSVWRRTFCFSGHGKTKCLAFAAYEDGGHAFPCGQRGLCQVFGWLGKKRIHPKSGLVFSAWKTKPLFFIPSTDRLSFFPHCFPGYPAGAGPGRGVHRPDHRNPADGEWF